jgi:hypothetical protein
LHAPHGDIERHEQREREEEPVEDRTTALARRALRMK